jgi:sugar phosphate isomerase/epimerase
METRRSALKKLAWSGVACMVLPACMGSSNRDPWFRISLAEWSLNRKIGAGELKHINFPEYTRKTFNISAVEYVSTLFPSNGLTPAYMNDLKNRCETEGVESLLIMIDNEGQLGDASEKARKQAVQNHFKWVEAANFLACHSIRVNAGGQTDRMSLKAAVVKSLSELAEFSKDFKIDIIVENHGGLSSDGAWLASVMKQVNLPNVGTLPDFGNFTTDYDKGTKYNMYKGVEELMPYAKAVSAKCYHFENGEETTIDFSRMMDIVKSAGYKGYVGIEFEGSKMSEDEGIRACKELLMKIGKSQL